MPPGDVPSIREELEDRPLQVLIDCEDRRALASRLLHLPMVHSVAFREESETAMMVEVRQAGAFFANLTSLLAEEESGIHLLTPLDDQLGALFDYLVEA